MSDPKWRKSIRCGPNNGCIEIAPLAMGIGIRDSHKPETVLTFTRDQFANFARRFKDQP